MLGFGPKNHTDLHTMTHPFFSPADFVSRAIAITRVCVYVCMCVSRFFGVFPGIFLRFRSYFARAMGALAECRRPNIKSIIWKLID